MPKRTEWNDKDRMTAIALDGLGMEIGWIEKKLGHRYSQAQIRREIKLLEAPLTLQRTQKIWKEMTRGANSQNPSPLHHLLES